MRAWNGYVMRAYALMALFVVACGSAPPSMFGLTWYGVQTQWSPRTSSSARARGATSLFWLREYRRVPGSTSPLRHELVHALAARHYVTQPRWFREGFAQLLEPVVANDREAVVGGVNFGALAAYTADRSISVRDLFAWESDRPRVRRRCVVPSCCFRESPTRTSRLPRIS
jgi:hypothetical protein